MQVNHELLALSFATEALLDANHDNLELTHLLNELLSPSFEFDIGHNVILNDVASV